MGMNIEQESFSEADYAAFTNQVHTELEVLQKLINTPGFGQGQGSIGAELEFYIIDPKGDVLPINQTIAKSMDDPQLTVELNRFNLEYNLKPQMLEPDAFSTLENNMTKAWHALNRVASDFDGRIIPIGILPLSLIHI